LLFFVFYFIKETFQNPDLHRLVLSNNYYLNNNNFTLQPLQYQYESRILSLPMNHSTEHRNHSALKIHCKARQALALVNTKLLEQQRLDNSKSTRLRSSNISTNKREESGFELTFKKEINECANDLLEKYVSTKDAFRPSTVKKKAKNSTEEEAISANNETNSKLTTSRRNLLSSKSTSLRQQKENILPSYKKYRNNTESNLKTKKVTNNEMRLSADLNEFSDVNENQLDIFEPPNSTTTVATPPLQPLQLQQLAVELKNASQIKSASELFNQILKESSLGTQQQQQRLHSSSSPTRTNSTFNYIQRSNNFNDESSKQFRKIVKKSANSSSTRLKSGNTNQSEDANFLNSLTEEEFLHFLKQYRQTKNLNAFSSSSHVTFLTEVAHRVDQERKEEESEEHKRKGKRTKTATFVRLPTQTTTLSLRTASNRVSSSISIAKKLQSTSRGDLHPNSNQQTNQHLNTITIDDREQLLNGHGKLPSYLENYLNKKMADKNLKPENNSNNSKVKLDQASVHSISSTSSTPTSLNRKKVNENKSQSKSLTASSKNLHRIKSSTVKVFNFPTLAN